MLFSTSSSQSRILPDSAMWFYKVRQTFLKLSTFSPTHRGIGAPLGSLNKDVLERRALT